MRSVFVLAITSLCFVGCAVPQPRGMGVEKLLSANGYPYWLYMPLGHDAGEKLPTVVSLHGLKPFDSAHGQCREWQQEADIRGLAIVAPDLRSPGLLAPLPLRKVTNDLERDGKAVVSILADLSRRDWFDPDAVLLTSWSYGGYVAHWVANRYPKLFTCLAVRQSNFNSRLLDPRRLTEYLYRRVGIFSTANDFEACRLESELAAAWYAQHGFDVVFSVMTGRGHERIPGPAANFFLRPTEQQDTQPVGFRVGMVGPRESEEESMPPRAEAGRLVRSDPAVFLELCLRNVENSVSDYRATFVKTERIGDQMRPAQRIAIRFMREPFSVHMTWLLNPRQVCRALYVAGSRVNGKGEEMAVLEPTGWVVRIFVSEVMRPIHGTDAASESRRSIDQFGFANMLRLSLKYFREVEGATLEFVGDAEFNGRAVWALRRTLPQGDGLPDVTLDLLVDKVWLVPLSAVAKGEGDILLGRYEFFDVELNAGYKMKDFEELGDAW